MVKQTELTSDEKLDLKMKYKAKHGEKPTDAFVRENMSVLAGSDKITLKTKQFQFQAANGRKDGGAHLPDDLPALARAVCEAKSAQWTRPRIEGLNGGGLLPLCDSFLSVGDKVAAKFSLGFIVYRQANTVFCNFKPYWSSEASIYRRRRTNVSGDGRPAAKKIKLDYADASFGSAVAHQTQASLAQDLHVHVKTEDANVDAFMQNLPDLDDY